VGTRDLVEEPHPCWRYARTEIGQNAWCRRNDARRRTYSEDDADNAVSRRDVGVSAGSAPPVGVSKMILLGVLRFHAVWKVTEEIVIRVATACRPSHGGGVVGCRDLSHNDLEPTGAGRGQIVRLPELTGGQSSFFGGSSLFVTSHGTPLTIGLI
jgi:hypothetical protein